jgi:ribonuclease III
MLIFQELQQHLPEIEKRIGYVFQNKDLLVLALIHRSYYNENPYAMPGHNERLEFLGDSVLGLIVSEYLYIHLPQEAEGHLSLLRSQLVEAGSCAKFLEELGVSRFILLGRGERSQQAMRGRATIMADLFEAIMGAIYLDGGFFVAKEFFLQRFEERLSEQLYRPQRNWKAELQDYSQKKYHKLPIYTVLKESGPDHNKVFHVAVALESNVLGEGAGASKKEAETIAAGNALRKLGIS